MNVHHVRDDTPGGDRAAGSMSGTLTLRFTVIAHLAAFTYGNSCLCVGSRLHMKEHSQSNQSL